MINRNIFNDDVAWGDDEYDDEYGDSNDDVLEHDGGGGELHL